MSEQHPVTTAELLAIVRQFAEEYRVFLDDTEKSIDSNFDEWLISREQKIKRLFSTAYHLVDKLGWDADENAIKR